MDEAQMLNRNALHALMGLEATAIKAGGFKYIHRDTGMVFEIAPATPNSAGQACWQHSYMREIQHTAVSQLGPLSSRQMLPPMFDPVIELKRRFSASLLSMCP